MIQPVSSGIFQLFVMYRLSLCRMWVGKAWDERVLRDTNVLKTALFTDPPRWPWGRDSSPRRWVLWAHGLPLAGHVGCARYCFAVVPPLYVTAGSGLLSYCPQRLRGGRALAWGALGRRWRTRVQTQTVWLQTYCRPLSHVTSATQGKGNGCQQVPNTVSPTLAQPAHQHQEMSLAFLLESSCQNPPSPSPPPGSKMIL